MAINTELLARVRDHILEEPRRYDQSTYKRPSVDTPCGTAACIAGWAVILTGAPTCTFDESNCGCLIGDSAQQVLGLTDKEADTLFDGKGERWPAQFSSDFYSARLKRDQPRMARIAADYLDHIIATGKVTD